MLLIFSFSLSDFIDSEEAETNRSKSNGKNTDPHQNSANPLCIKIYKEIGIDQGGGRGGNQNRRIKPQDDCLKKKEDHVSDGKAHRSDGIIPLAPSALTEQEPISYVQNRKNNVEAQAANTPVRLRITSLGTCEHKVKYKEGQKNSQHSDKFQHGSNRDVAVLFLFYCLYQRGKHNTNTKKVTDIGEVYVKIPSNRVDIIEDSEACDDANESKRAIDRLENKLCGPVFDHDVPLFLSDSIRLKYIYNL